MMSSKNNDRRRLLFSALFLPGMMFLIGGGMLPLYGLDNLGGQDYGQIGPVMFYDSATGQSSPFLPVGWYYWWPPPPPSLFLLDEVAASGANTVVFTSLADDPAWLWDHAIDAMDRAEQLDLKVVLGFSPNMLLSIDPAVPTSSSHLIRWIQQFRNHPALLGWQLGDENGGIITADMVNMAADTVRLLDPFNQIWQVFTLHDDGAKLVDYMQETDVSSFDRYGYFDWIGLFGAADWIIELQNHKASLGTANGWAGNVNVVQGYGNDTGTVFPDQRFPNYDEYRHLVFSAFASAGARGTLSWIYYYDDRNWYTTNSVFTDWRDTVCQPIQLEQQMIAHAMETGWNVGNVSANIDGLLISGPSGGQFGKVSHLLTYDNITQYYYLIVTNNSFETMPVELTLTQLPDAITSLVADIPESGGSVTLVDLGGGGFQLNDTLDNHEVKIYRIYADGLPTFCGGLRTIYLESDMVQDCYVNQSDFARFTAQWQFCTDPANEGCNPYWESPSENPLPPVILNDGFDGPDTTPDNPPPGWLHRGDKLDMLVSSNKLVPELTSSDALNMLFFDAPNTGSETSEKVSLDLTYTIAQGSTFLPKFRLSLNSQSLGTTWGHEDSYYLEIRGNNDINLFKNVAGAAEQVGAWTIFAGGLLVENQTYRVELERVGSQVTARVLDGVTLLGETGFTDAGTPFLGGYAMVATYHQGGGDLGYVIDNFEYEADAPQSPLFCGDEETVYLESDLIQDCYVGLTDLGAFGSQWLWCSDPAQAACDQYWQ